KHKSCPHTHPPVGHAQTPLCVGYVSDGKRSPGSAAFPPHSPPTMSRLCSNDSSVLCRCMTPRRRARGPYGLSLLPPSCRYRNLRGLPVLVCEVSRRVWGLRLRRIGQELALTLPSMLPSAHVNRVGIRVVSFVGSRSGAMPLRSRLPGAPRFLWEWTHHRN